MPAVAELRDRPRDRARYGRAKRIVWGIRNPPVRHSSARIRYLWRRREDQPLKTQGKLTDPPDRQVLAFSPESLRWAMGLFCAFVGAFVLVAPHRFAAPPYHALASFRSVWGMAALTAGVTLLAVAVMRPRPAVRLAVHILGCVPLLSLAASFARDMVWSGVAAYPPSGVANGLAGPLPP